jgi:hypothetical protein
LEKRFDGEVVSKCRCDTFDAHIVQLLRIGEVAAKLCDGLLYMHHVLLLQRLHPRLLSFKQKMLLLQNRMHRMHVLDLLLVLLRGILQVRNFVPPLQ